MAFAPEVRWGMQLAGASTARIGFPTAFESIFADPYATNLASARSRLGSSWIDSAINALSVLDRFASAAERTSLRAIGPCSWSAYEGRFTCRADNGHSLPAVIVTTWHVTAPAKTTRIKYESGAELVMDHTAVAGYLLENGAVTDVFGTDGSIPRRETHYSAMYQQWLVDGAIPWSTDDSWRLHQLLLQPA